MSSFLRVNSMPLAHKILVPRRVALKRITHLRLIGLVVIAMALTGCWQQSEHGAQLPDCQPAARWCDLVTAADGQRGGRWRIAEAELQVEQELHFVIEVDAPAVADVRGQVAGVNMAMGSMPVFIDVRSGGRIEGRLLLPACTSELMRWQLKLAVATDTGSALTLQSPVFETGNAR